MLSKVKVLFYKLSFCRRRDNQTN